MSVIIIKKSVTPARAITRQLSITAVASTKKWRVERGLPANRTAEGIVTDGPDYTYLDGRPTPLLVKQKKRMDQQKEFASKIVEMCAELDFAKDRQQKMLQAQEEKRQNILANRLKPKGHTISKNFKN